jgi:hypothetical protein
MAEADIDCGTLRTQKTFLDHRSTYRSLVIDLQVMRVREVAVCLLCKSVVRDKALVCQAMNVQISEALSELVE